MIFIEAALFVLSSGLLFSERFRGNILLVVIAGTLALVSSYLLMQQLFGPADTRAIIVQQPPAAQGPAKWETTHPIDIPGAREAIQQGTPYVTGCADLDDGTRDCVQIPTTLPESTGSSSAP